MTVVLRPCCINSINGKSGNSFGNYTFNLSSRWSFANYFLTDKHRRICEVFSLPRSFWFYEWSRSNHYTSSIIPLVGLNSAKSTLEVSRLFRNIHACFRHFDSVNLLFNPPLTKAIPSALQP
jgi:hypothetical protein